MGDIGPTARSAATCSRTPRKKEKQKNTQAGIFRLSIQCPEEKGATLFLPVTLRNANRFSKFFYRHTLQ